MGRDVLIDRLKQQASIKLSESVINGDMQWVFDAMAHHHQFNTMNCILIASQLPDAKLVAYKSDWERILNRQIKPNERAIATIEKIQPGVQTIIGKPIENSNQKSYNMSTSIIEKEISALAFDVTQTFGEPLPAILEDLNNGRISLQSIQNAISTIQLSEMEPLSSYLFCKYFCIKSSFPDVSGYFNRQQSIGSIFEKLDSILSTASENIEAVQDFLIEQIKEKSLARLPLKERISQAEVKQNSLQQQEKINKKKEGEITNERI